MIKNELYVAPRIWYAVQTGNDYDWDTGSYEKNEAEEIANKYAEDDYYTGEEIRITLIEETTSDKVCIDEIIIREGNR